MLCFLMVTTPVGRRNESERGKDETMPEWNLTDPTRTDSSMRRPPAPCLPRRRLRLCSIRDAMLTHRCYRRPSRASEIEYELVRGVGRSE